MIIGFLQSVACQTRTNKLLSSVIDTIDIVRRRPRPRIPRTPPLSLLLPSPPISKPSTSASTSNCGTVTNGNNNNNNSLRTGTGHTRTRTLRAAGGQRNDEGEGERRRGWKERGMIELHGQGPCRCVTVSCTFRNLLTNF